MAGTDAPAPALVVIDAPRICRLLSYPLLLAHLRSAFACRASSIAAPPRHLHPLPPPDEVSSPPSFLLMPAWPLAPSPSSYMGVKVVAVFPHNTRVALPSTSASYLLSSSSTGFPLAFLDGKELTLWRTACVSALAAAYLAPQDARVLLMVGAGALAPHLVLAHMASRPTICKVLIWNRTHSRAQELAKTLQPKLPSSTAVHACLDIEEAARTADLITCATLSEQPLVLGAWLKPSTHLDLVGSFTPSMKECDDHAIRRGKVYVDTDVACHEAGELAGAAFPVDVQGTLSQLATGEKQGRLCAHDITVFKSVGCAHVDLETASFIYERHKSEVN